MLFLHTETQSPAEEPAKMQDSAEMAEESKPASADQEEKDPAAPVAEEYKTSVKENTAPAKTQSPAESPTPAEDPGKLKQASAASPAAENASASENEGESSPAADNASAPENEGEASPAADNAFAPENEGEGSPAADQASAPACQEETLSAEKCGKEVGWAKKNRTPGVNVRYMAATAMLGALAAALMLLQFPIPLVPGFLQFDFSELPALIASFSMGPLYGVLVCLIKNLVHLPATFTFGVGELSNFLLGCALVVPAGIWYRIRKNRKGALLGALSGTLCMGLLSFPSNYFITYPVYAVVFIPGATLEEGMGAIIGMYQAILPWADTLPKCLLVFNLPFTMAKGLADAAITFLIYKYISPLIKGVKKKK